MVYVANCQNYNDQFCLLEKYNTGPMLLLWNSYTIHFNVFHMKVCNQMSMKWLKQFKQDSNHNKGNELCAAF